MLGAVDERSRLVAAASADPMAVERQRSLRVGPTREEHEPDAILRAVGDELPHDVLHRVEPAGPLAVDGEVLGEHAPRDVHREHDVDTLAMHRGLGRAELRPRQRDHREAEHHRAQEPEDVPRHPLVRGRRVRHPRYGYGVILAQEGSGDETRLTVYFDRAGKKKFVARYADLTLA